MKQYHKIDTVWLRNPATNFRTLLEGEWSQPEFGYLANAEWRWTEKIDGTNIRIIWDGEIVRFGGKTDKAQIPTKLLDRLQDIFPREKMKETFDDPICLYGEGYGASIQKVGGRYKSDGVDFILFDARIGDLWLEPASVTEIAAALSIDEVPLRAIASLGGAIRSLRSSVRMNDIPVTKVRGADTALPIEGYVLRPNVALHTRFGKRVIAKLKCKDFTE